MSKINDFVKEVKEEAVKYSNHPAAELDVEEKYLYLKGLALIANADDKIIVEEKEYLASMILSLNLPKDTIEIFLGFANDPDKEVYFEIIEFLKKSDLRFTFLIDGLILSQKDGEFHDEEKELLHNFYSVLNITSEEQSELEEIFNAVVKREQNSLIRVIRGNGYISKEVYSFLFDFYKIDVQKIDEEEKKREKEELEKLLNFEIIEIKKDVNKLTNNSLNGTSSGSIGNFINSLDALSRIANASGLSPQKPYVINRHLSKERINRKIFTYFLQYKMDLGLLKIDNNGIILNNRDYITCDLKMSEIIFYKGLFSYSTNGDLTGVTLIGIKDFIDWINLNSQFQWQIPQIDEIGISFLSEWYTFADYTEELFYLIDKKEYVTINKNNEPVILNKDKPSEHSFRLELVYPPTKKKN